MTSLFFEKLHPTGTPVAADWNERMALMSSSSPATSPQPPPPQAMSFSAPAVVDSSSDDDSESSESASTAEAKRRAMLGPAFFQPLLTADAARRAEGTAALLTALAKDGALLSAHLSSLVRLSETAPFPDVADSIACFLRSVAESQTDIAIPTMPRASRFIAQESIPSVRTVDGCVAAAFRDAFVRTGRVSHLNRVLAMHPSYYAQHHTTMNTFLRQDGPLPVCHRFYIAIMAAAQYDCKYLVQVMESEFRLRGGDEAWLLGIEHAPPKLRALAPVLVTLAQRPWHLTKDHIRELVKAGPGNAWSIGEIVSALVLACTFLALAGVALGTGVNEEIDLKGAAAAAAAAAVAAAVGSASQQASTAAPLAEFFSGSPLSVSSSPRSLLETFDVATRKLEDRLRGEARTPAPDEDGSDTEGDDEATRSEQQTAPACPHLAKYRPATGQVGHEDFNPHATGMFPIQEFSWDEHGYELVERFFSDAASLLDDLFTLTFNLTYHTFGGSGGIETDRFRQAIWYYVQLIHGVSHDDYDYHQINKFLRIDGEHRLKHYVKIVSCMPYAIRRAHFDSMGINLRPDEKVHICLLASESRKQVGLIYGLRAVMGFMDSE